MHEDLLKKLDDALHAATYHFEAAYDARNSGARMNELHHKRMTEVELHSAEVTLFDLRKRLEA